MSKDTANQRKFIEKSEMKERDDPVLIYTKAQELLEKDLKEQEKLHEKESPKNMPKNKKTRRFFRKNRK